MTVTIHHGDCVQVMKTLPEKSVHTCVTSPPYWGLRNYNVDGQIGLEPSPQEFIDKMVEVFAEVWRVLRDDGTCWINMGDSYAGAPGGFQGKNGQRASRTFTARIDLRKKGNGLKPKDLVGMPWRVAFALQEFGWYLRQDIVWHKPNPMPESVADRCTKAHEYIFLLAKSERYYFDQIAILEERSENTHPRTAKNKTPAGWDTSTGEGGHGTIHREGRNNGTGVGWGYATDEKPRTKGKKVPGNKSHKGTAAYEAGDEAHRTKGGLVDYSRKVGDARDGVKANADWWRAHEGLVDKRNKRSVWTVGSQAFTEAHFATFPPKLIEPCILAGCPEGGTVLDPFFGAGTTGMVADRLQRNCVGIELNYEYIEIAKRRLFKDAGLFNHVVMA